MPAKSKTELTDNDLLESPDNPTDDNTDKKKKNKKEKNDKKKEKKRDKSKDKDKGFPIIPVLLLLLIIGGIVAVLWLNLFNIRDQYVLPFLRNAPLVGRYIPAAESSSESPTESTSQPGSQGTSSGGEFASLTRAELEALATDYKYQLQKAEADLKTAQDLNKEYEQTIENLRGYESLITEYRETKANFDAMVAHGDPEGYAQYYASVSPENADQLYKEVIAENQYTAEQKKYAATYANMSEDAAAAALEQMLPTEPDLVVMILRNMDNVHVAAIYDEMTKESVAIISRLMAPTPVTVTPRPTAPPMPTPVPVEETADVTIP